MENNSLFATSVSQASGISNTGQTSPNTPSEEDISGPSPIDVIIPVRNEQKTIFNIVYTLRTHPLINNVFVAIDADTTDASGKLAHEAGALVLPYKDIRGKGQLITCVVKGQNLTDTILLCDGDYTNLTTLHIYQMTMPWEFDRNYSMLIGIPDYPNTPDRRVLQSWPWVSGIRRVPKKLMLAVFYGYLLEFQLNKLARRTGMTIRWERLTGLKSPLNLTSKRLFEMERDRQWGLENGVFDG